MPRASSGHRSHRTYRQSRRCATDAVLVKSVTVSHTRELARQFRNRYGNFLLVLTTPVRPPGFCNCSNGTTPSRSPTGINEITGGASSPVLTVSQTRPTRQPPGPSTVHLHGGDPFAQFDKLRSASTSRNGRGVFNNRALFSDYYLKNACARRPPGRSRNGYQDLVGYGADETSG